MPPALTDIAQALALLLGATVLSLAGVQILVGWPPIDVVARAASVVGVVFPSVFAVLTVVAGASALRLMSEPANRRWRQVGLQAASGIATLALTFTLLGISLGIGGLADRPLTPASVQEVIGELTGRFALAFATTVVGLPAAAGLRALILVLSSREVRL
ncbi:hypothetical protein BAL199_19848 [alpha proteobacterium BAL199]|jgi:NADH:ubiquinone oxidoreductase subunit 6 (subunit J)|nr:hypothetical protein BAL199_19848 [alpha proteobacterium BAL199]